MSDSTEIDGIVIKIPRKEAHPCIVAVNAVNSATAQLEDSLKRATRQHAGRHNKGHGPLRTNNPKGVKTGC